MIKMFTPCFFDFRPKYSDIYHSPPFNQARSSLFSDLSLERLSSFQWPSIKRQFSRFVQRMMTSEKEMICAYACSCMREFANSAALSILRILVKFFFFFFFAFFHMHATPMVGQSVVFQFARRCLPEKVYTAWHCYEKHGCTMTSGT